MIVKTDLFPICVGKISVTDIFTDEMKKEIMSQLYEDNEKNKISQNKFILNEKIFASAKNKIEFYMQQYFKEIYSPKENLTVKITQSWLNITQKNEQHHTHAHPNSILSAVLYLNTDSEDRIRFHSPYESSSVVNFHNYDKEFTNLYNAAACEFLVSKNDLIIFPSFLRHDVPTKNTDGHRVSIAINSFYDGVLGNIHSATHLKIRVDND